MGCPKRNASNTLNLCCESSSVAQNIMLTSIVLLQLELIVSAKLLLYSYKNVFTELFGKKIDYILVQSYSEENLVIKLCSATEVGSASELRPAAPGSPVWSHQRQVRALGFSR